MLPNLAEHAPAGRRIAVAAALVAAAVVALAVRAPRHHLPGRAHGHHGVTLTPIGRCSLGYYVR
jgi:hypothetical protein